MKIAIVCNDLLLEKALVLFLKDFLVSKKDCDFIITDEKKQNIKKPQFVIGKTNSHIKIPFTKEVLLETLYEFAGTISQSSNKILTFEEKLDNLLNKFKFDLIKLVNEK